MDALLTSLLLPVLLMVVFVELFGGAINTGTGTRYASYMVPDVLALCAGFGSTLTAVAVATDFGRAMVDRLRSMDVPAPSLLAGHVAAGVARNAASGLLVLVVAILLGFRGLVLGRPLGASAWVALAWCGGILLASVAGSAAAVARRMAT